MRPIRVLEADDHDLFRAGLRSLLQNIAGIGFAWVDHKAHQAGVIALCRQVVGGGPRLTGH
jgi:DNA-binding NarL/FixJ family response regulator